MIRFFVEAFIVMVLIAALFSVSMVALSMLVVGVLGWMIWTVVKDVFFQ